MSSSTMLKGTQRNVGSEIGDGAGVGIGAGVNFFGGLVALFGG